MNVRDLHPDLVVITTYQNEFEAGVAKTALDAAGIRSTIWSDSSGYGPALVFTQGIRLLVASDDLQRARKVLAEN